MANGLNSTFHYSDYETAPCQKVPFVSVSDFRIAPSHFEVNKNP